MPFDAPAPVRALLGAAMLSSALAGCASLVAPGTHVPALAELPVPPGWSAEAGDGAAPAATPEALAGWWRHFDDPMLADLVTQALARSTDVRSAAAALRQARAQRDVEAAGLLPSVGGSASAQRSRSAGGTTGSLFRFGFDASWEPDLFGAQRSGVGAAEAGAQAGEAALADVQVSIAAETASAYLALRAAQSRLAIARDNLALQAETLQITDWRAQAGLTTSLELEQARAITEQTRSQLPTLALAAAQARSSLAVLSGRAPGELDALLREPAPVPVAPLALAASLPAQTLAQRPDVRRAQRQVAAALGRLKQADAQRQPSVQLGGSIGLSALTLGGLSGGGAGVGALLASLSAPLFDGGAGAGRVAVQDAVFEQATLAYEAAVLGALKDVEDALVALSAAGERQARLQQAAEAASNAALLARQRYAGGVVDFQTVLETQRTQLGAQDGLASARADVATAQVRLYKALGGGWTPGPDATPALSAPL